MSLLSLTKPSGDRLGSLVDRDAMSQLTYTQVGATLTTLPVGWSTDERQVVLGKGEETYSHAVEALKRWDQFDLDWVAPLSTEVPLREGELFTFLAYTLGVWSVNMCRIVYVVDDDDGQRARFGFAYGTVGAHSVRGEEQFMLEWNQNTNVVTFTIRKFSLPASVLLRVLGPVTRWVQGRFTRDALARMAAGVGS